MFLQRSRAVRSNQLATSFAVGYLLDFRQRFCEFPNSTGTMPRRKLARTEYRYTTVLRECMHVLWDGIARDEQEFVVRVMPHGQEPLDHCSRQSFVRTRDQGGYGTASILSLCDYPDVADFGCPSGTPFSNIRGFANFAPFGHQERSYLLCKFLVWKLSPVCGYAHQAVEVITGLGYAEYRRPHARLGSTRAPLNRECQCYGSSDANDDCCDEPGDNRQKDAQAGKLPHEVLHGLPLNNERRGDGPGKQHQHEQNNEGLVAYSPQARMTDVFSGCNAEVFGLRFRTHAVVRLDAEMRGERLKVFTGIVAADLVNVDVTEPHLIHVQVVDGMK
ncbi:MAG: hypothetical protein H6817_07070 [Phycisphaerales bacterium]|nr:hypothetical protein [Phycisphaerales bacterium]